MKRLLDFLGAAFGLILLSPILLWLAWRIRQDMDGPILFRQNRTGKGGKLFKMIKFRTMRDKLDENRQQLPDSERLTPFGIKLRSTSADELTELWNVLKGEMSLVGPRPLLMEYLPLYTFEQARRHEVRPGITGWAQVNGRNAISWEEKFELDVWYIDNRTIWLDFVILWITVKKVLTREGISSDMDATMPKFTGSKCSIND